MMAHPENPPKIDWQYYVNTVPIPGLVQEFKQKYEAYKIPVPAVDTYYAQLDKKAVEVDQEINAFKTESNKRIADFEKELARLRAAVPLDVMTYEEMYIHFPEFGIDRKEPGFWPHDIDQKDMAAPAEH